MATTSRRSARPLSISNIGWLMVASGVLALALATLRVPLECFGMVLTGWRATAGILVLAVADLLTGFGLLRLNAKARVAAIALVALFVLNISLNALNPEVHAQLLQAMKTMPFAPPSAYRPAPPPPPLAFRLLPVTLFAIPLWFLVRRKSAFAPAATH